MCIERQIMSNKSNSNVRIAHGLLGYTYEKTSFGEITVINSKEAKIVKTVFDLFLNGRFSMKAIADKLNNDPQNKTKRNKGLFTQVQISRILKHPEYCGMCFDQKSGKFLDSQDFDPIIERNEWIKAQTVLPEKNKEHRGHKNIQYPLSGLIKCKYCGAYYYSKGRNYYYHKPITIRNECPNKNRYIRREQIEKYVINLIKYNILQSPNDNRLLKILIDYQYETKRNYEPYEFDLAEQIKLKETEYTKIDLECNKTSLRYDNGKGKKVSQQLDRLIDSKSKKSCELQPYNEKIILGQLSPYNKIDRNDLLNIIIRNIEVSNKTLIVNFKQDVSMLVNLNELDYNTDALIARVNYLYTNNKKLDNFELYLNDKINNIKTTEDSIEEDYIHFLYKIRAEQNKMNNQMLTKVPLPREILCNVKNISKILFLHDIYQYNGYGEFFVIISGKEVVVNVFQTNNMILAVSIKDNLFFNRYFTQSNLANTNNSGIHNYFDIDNEKIVFTLNSNRVLAYDYSNLIYGKETPIDSAIDKIISGKDVKFIE
jgi:hypothetical protein